MMNERGKSDSSVVPGKSPNNGGAQKQEGHGGPYPGTKAETPDTAKEFPASLSRQRSTLPGCSRSSIAAESPCSIACNGIQADHWINSISTRKRDGFFCQPR